MIDDSGVAERRRRRRRRQKRQKERWKKNSCISETKNSGDKMRGKRCRGVEMNKLWRCFSVGEKKTTGSFKVKVSEVLYVRFLFVIIIWGFT